MVVTEEQLNELYKRVDVACKHFPQLRYGQAMFNEAYSMWHEFVNTIRGTNDDCFYQDSKVEAFLSHFEVAK
jgi:hypothetical protein